MQYQWGDEEYKRLPPFIQKARDMLEDWFWAMENSVVDLRMPDPLYSPPITQEQADAAVKLLDEEFDRELTWASGVDGEGYTAGPAFGRLGPMQRVALMQGLQRLRLESKDDKDAEPPQYAPRYPLFEGPA